MKSYETPQPFDGTQPEISNAERERVTKRFSALVEDTLLNHPEDVRHHEYAGAEDSLVLSLPMGDSDKLRVGVRNKTGNLNRYDGILDPSEVIKSEISIQEIKNGYGRDAVSYRFNADGIVRRHDRGDKYGKRQENKKLGIDTVPLSRGTSTENIVVQAVKSLEKLLSDDIPNRRLERQMGYNNQPVGIEEIDKVCDLLASPGFEVFKDY